MNKKIQYIVGVIIIVLVVLLIVISNKPKDATTIKIGAILPLTGSQAFVGGGLKNSLTLALKDLEKKNLKYKYEVIFEDTQFDPKTAVTLAQKLIDIDHVDAIVDAYAPIGNAISPITEAKKVIHIGIAFDPKIAEGKYNFLLFTKPDTAASSLLGEMQKKGIKNIGVFHVNNQGILAVYHSLQKLSKDYGITITADGEFQPGERDFRGIIAKSIKAKPDIYVLLALSPELEILAKQMNEQGLHNQTSTIYFELAQDKNVFNGLWSIGYSQTNPDFENEYKAEYNQDMTFGIPNMYDAFNLIVNSAESYTGGGKPSADYIADKIQNIKDVQGSLGTLNINSDGIIDSPTTVKIMKDGKMQTEK